MTIPTPPSVDFSRKLFAAILAATKGDCELACKILREIADDILKSTLETTAEPQKPKSRTKRK